ncbi:hypothetical protein IR083_21050 [Dysgonomonas sp. GY75]|uniref:hypothetical protein n=1 Tax=Dysgonomonas sp. GY75 TaxID=2780419 RepID=UPI00188331BA|nr:hypothetical protein [Dysgonomonas sp. GY75]MBF0651309.1 hypothetical protein [Dysgonomonas sp. GY75]
MSEQIKETEIMKGNYFSYDNKIVFIAEILKSKLVTIYDGSGLEKGTTLGCLRPIPLTEDILLKCGFEKRNTDQIRYKRDTIELTYVEFWDEDDDGNEISFKEWKLSELYHSDLFYYKSFPSIDYLHQLQNLFKSLTGTDLKVEV